MYLGKIVELAPADELFNKPAHPYTQALLSAIPALDPNKKKQKHLLEGEVPSPINPPKGCRFYTRCSFVKKLCREAEPQQKHLGGDHFVVFCSMSSVLKCCLVLKVN